MNVFHKYVAYLKDNRQGYWFKRRLFGWGWVPVRWQGGLVIAVSAAIGALGIYIGETDDAPGAALLGVLLMIGILFFFGYWKGEKPHWTWGFPEGKEEIDGGVERK